MRNFIFVIAAIAAITFASCEQEAILNLDPWFNVKPCEITDSQSDFVGQLDFYPHAQGSTIHIHDWSFPDFGENQYFAIVQYLDQSGAAQCAGFLEVAPFRFTIPAEFLNEARIVFRRQTLGEDGEVLMQVDSPYFFFTNNTYQQ